MTELFAKLVNRGREKHKDQRDVDEDIVVALSRRLERVEGERLEMKERLERMGVTVQSALSAPGSRVSSRRAVRVAVCSAALSRSLLTMRWAVGLLRQPQGPVQWLGLAVVVTRRQARTSHRPRSVPARNQRPMPHLDSRSSTLHQSL